MKQRRQTKTHDELRGSPEGSLVVDLLGTPSFPRRKADLKTQYRQKVKHADVLRRLGKV
jgi:hypothetical protein